MKQTYKSTYKRQRPHRQDVIVYIAAVAFLIGYLFGAGFFSFSVG